MEVLPALATFQALPHLDSGANILIAYFKNFETTPTSGLEHIGSSRIAILSAHTRISVLDQHKKHSFFHDTITYPHYAHRQPVHSPLTQPHFSVTGSRDIRNLYRGHHRNSKTSSLNVLARSFPFLAQPLVTKFFPP